MICRRAHTETISFKVAIATYLKLKFNECFLTLKSTSTNFDGQRWPRFRQALFGVATAAKLGGIRYTYGDELPKKIPRLLYVP